MKKIIIKLLKNVKLYVGLCRACVKKRKKGGKLLYLMLKQCYIQEMCQLCYQRSLLFFLYMVIIISEWSRAGTMTVISCSHAADLPKQECCSFLVPVCVDIFVKNLLILLLTFAMDGENPASFPMRLGNLLQCDI